ncbi:MAG: DUF4185 domain-containing protein [Deltaproteobacteria bacterium]|nr:DUF4185 domain-containing protein [Deltaproteobacteria bacterium]
MAHRNMNRRAFTYGSAGLLTSLCAHAPTRDAAASPARPVSAPPLPKSKLIRGFEFTGPAFKYPGTATDMHWWTWGADGELYVVDDDGHNFDNPWHFAHLLRVSGVPPQHKVEEISRFPGLRRQNTAKVRYVSGALAVDKRLYVAAYDYDYSFPGNERWRLTEKQSNNPIRPDAATMLLDAVSSHAGVAGIMYSDDAGNTWQNIPDASTPYFLGPNFGGLAFVGFGPGYTDVPKNLEPYVYALSNDENWETGNNIFMARVPRERILDRAAWQFYAGVAGEPAWTNEEFRARPILSDPGKVGHPSMTWNAGLGRFLLAYFSDVVPHSLATMPEVAAKTWHRARQLTIVEGPTPWGPWALVHHEPKWEGEHVAYLPQIPSKWLSADGMQGTLLFSGDYSQFTKPPAPKDSYYAFMTRPFRLIPR